MPQQAFLEAAALRARDVNAIAGNDISLACTDYYSRPILRGSRHDATSRTQIHSSICVRNKVRDYGLLHHSWDCGFPVFYCESARADSIRWERLAMLDLAPLSEASVLHSKDLSQVLLRCRVPAEALLLLLYTVAATLV